MPSAAALGIVTTSGVLAFALHARSAPKKKGAPAAPGRSRNSAKAAAAALVAAWAMLGVGAVPPVAGFLKVATFGPPPPPAPPSPPPPKSVWAEANVVLVGPGGTAVGLARGTDPDGLEYLLIVSADKKSSEQAVKQARTAGVRILSSDSGSVGSLAKSVGIGHPIPTEKGIEVARLLFDRRPWAGSGLVLSAPDGAAVGLARVSLGDGKRPGYALKAKVPASLSDLATGAAFDAGRKVLEVDRALLSSISQAPASIGQMIDESLARLVDDLFRPRRFPGQGEYVTFEDIQSRRRRVGMNAGVDEKSVRFVELLDGVAQAPVDSPAAIGPATSPRADTIPRSRIPANSLRVLRSHEELRESADLLDYLLYRMAGRLNSDAPVALRLAVLPTTVLDPVAEARRRRDASAAQARKAMGQSNVADWYDAVTLYQKLGPGSLARYAPEVRLAIEAQLLASELRKGLNEMRIELREPSGPDAIEMVYRGLGILVPPGEVDLRKRMGEAAVRSQLLGATHALASEIAPAQERGRYQLSLRLFDIESGKLIWSDRGDRREASLAVLGSELASYPYVLNTGEVSLMDFGDKFHPPMPREITTIMGGLPLRLGNDYKLMPMIRNEHVFWDISRKKQALEDRELKLFNGYPVPNGIYTRLGYREKNSPGDPQAIAFRDLFGRTIEDVPIESIRAMDDAKKRGNGAGIIPAPSFGSIPYAHQMRYLIWTLARGALPVAGRVGGQRDDTYRVKMGKDHRLRMKDRLVVRRPGEGDLPDRILATELVVTQVEEDYVTAVLAHDQATLPGAEPARSGDLVQRKPTEKIRVAVAPPSIIADAPPPRMPGRPKATNSLSAAKANEIAQRLAEMVAGGLEEVGVPLVERREFDQVLKAQNISDIERQLKLVGQTSIATHIVVGNIKPGSDYSMTNLKMVEVATGDVVASISGYHFTKATREAWKP